MTLTQLLHDKLAAALIAAGVPDAQPLLQPASRPEFGDFQANGVMAAAKQRKMNPRELAQQVAAIALPVIVVCEVLGVLLAATALWRSGDAHRGVGRAALQRGGKRHDA